MNNDLVKQLQETDLFPPPSKKELAIRQQYSTGVLAKDLETAFTAYEQNKIDKERLQSTLYRMCDDKHADCDFYKCFVEKNILTDKQKADFDCPYFKNGAKLFGVLSKWRATHGKFPPETVVKHDWPPKATT